MNFYSVKTGLATELSQQELTDLLKSAGAEVIQTSDGVCLKLDKNIESVLQSNDKLAKLNFQMLDPKASDLAVDVKAFIEK